MYTYQKLLPDLHWRNTTRVDDINHKVETSKTVQKQQILMGIPNDFPQNCGCGLDCTYHSLVIYTAYTKNSAHGPRYVAFCCMCCLLISSHVNKSPRVKSSLLGQLYATCKTYYERFIKKQFEGNESPLYNHNETESKQRQVQSTKSQIKWCFSNRYKDTINLNLPWIASLC